VTALGTERDLDGVRKNVDATEHALACVLGKLDVFSCHWEQLLRLQLGGMKLSGGLGLRRTRENAENVALFHDEKIFAIDLHFASRPLAEQDAIANLHIERNSLARFIASAGTDGDHFALLGLFLCGVGDDDPARSLCFFLNALHDNTIVERTER